MDAAADERVDGPLIDNVDHLSFEVFMAFRRSAYTDIMRSYRFGVADAEDAVSEAYLRFRRYAPVWIRNVQEKRGWQLDSAILRNYLGKSFRYLCRQEARAIVFKRSIFDDIDGQDEDGRVFRSVTRVGACQEINCDARMMVDAVLRLSEMQQKIIFRMADGLTLPQISEELGESEAVLRVQRTAALSSLLRSAGTSLQAALTDRNGRHR